MIEACPAAFARRLHTASPAPIVVGLSGGGNSVATLILTKAWADRVGRPVIALTVDHGLQPDSAGWTAFAGEAAARLGCGFRALAWTGEKPARGLPAAARDARHRLLAEAAREVGARVLVLGHTADDMLEAEVMRGWGSTLGALREWSPSPAWPEGRGLFILRPLLAQRRATIRAWLTERGERWIDDPANADPTQMRARARLAIAGGGGQPVTAPDDDPAAGALALDSAGDEAGGVRIARAALRAAPAGTAARVLASALLSVGGGTRPPRGDRLSRLMAHLTGEGPVKATLCGAKVIADGQGVLIVRDAGEAARGGLLTAALGDGAPIVWDGRFELTADRPGLKVRPLAGLAARLDAVERRALAAVPAAARPALPAILAPDGSVRCPIFGHGAARARSLALARMQAACGAIIKEPAA